MPEPWRPLGTAAAAPGGPEPADKQQQESARVAVMVEMLLAQPGQAVAPPPAALLSEGNEVATPAYTGTALLPT
jgi:hypothetical protein